MDGAADEFLLQHRETDWQWLWERAEGSGSRGERKVEGFADGADFIQLHAARGPLGLDLILSANPKGRLDSFPRGLRNEDLAAGGEGFNTPG